MDFVYCLCVSETQNIEHSLFETGCVLASSEMVGSICLTCLTSKSLHNLHLCSYTIAQQTLCIFETLGNGQSPNITQSKLPNTTVEVPKNLFTYHIIRLADVFSSIFKSTPCMRSSLFSVVTQPVLLLHYRSFGESLSFLSSRVSNPRIVLIFKYKQSKNRSYFQG